MALDFLANPLCAHAQNYVNNDILPGESAATKLSKSPITEVCVLRTARLWTTQNVWIISNASKF